MTSSKAWHQSKRRCRHGNPRSQIKRQRQPARRLPGGTRSLPVPPSLCVASNHSLFTACRNGPPFLSGKMIESQIIIIFLKKESSSMVLPLWQAQTTFFPLTSIVAAFATSLLNQARTGQGNGNLCHAVTPVKRSQSGPQTKTGDLNWGQTG